MATLKVSDRIKDNKDLIFDLCEQKGVDKFSVTFDGSGDSGQIDEVSLDSKILSLDVVAQVEDGTQWVNGASKPLWRDAKDLRDLIESVCYDVLENTNGGWEINDGSFGEFLFDVKKRKVKLDFNERIMESNLTEYRF